jgi:hypothetical protein
LFAWHGVKEAEKAYLKHGHRMACTHLVQDQGHGKDELTIFYITNLELIPLEGKKIVGHWNSTDMCG